MEHTPTEATTISDVMEIASWNRQRSSEELQSFVTARLSAIEDL